jgi:hypothetical protein
MLTIDSKAALKRIPVGTKLRLVCCLMGPCDRLRTVKAVRSNDLVMDTEKGDSYLTLNKGDRCTPTEKGFRITNPEVKGNQGEPLICAEYEFVE